MIKMEKGPTLNDEKWHHVEVSQQRKVCYRSLTCAILLQSTYFNAIRLNRYEIKNRFISCSFREIAKLKEMGCPPSWNFYLMSKNLIQDGEQLVDL